MQNLAEEKVNSEIKNKEELILEAVKVSGNGKITNFDEFVNKFDMDMGEIKKIAKIYPMRVTPYYLSLIKEKNDPIWKICMPDARELQDDVGEEDPLHEEIDSPVPGLTHRYPDRVLLLINNECAMYCRFCTRKRKVGDFRKRISLEQIKKGIEYIKEHDEIRDVLLSGGEPFLLSDEKLEYIIKEIRAIKHVQIIRIGTRIPCVLPERITPKLCEMLKKYHPLYINIHFSHPNEITEESRRACEMLADSGIPLGSQTVLLKGVNDDPIVMKELMQKLVEMRVRPYYIYQADLVKGTEHFRTKVEDGLRIIKAIRGFTSGLCVPHYVIDSPGGGGKIPVLPNYMVKHREGVVVLRNYEGKYYNYPEPK